MSDRIWSLVKLKEKILRAREETNVLVLISSQDNISVLSHFIHSQKGDSDHWVKLAFLLDPVSLPKKKSPYKVVLSGLSFERSNLNRINRWCDKKRGFLGFC